MADSIETLKARYPGYDVVDVVDNPGPEGGQWALLSDGGVMALDGAPYLGSYYDDRVMPAGARDDPNRRFEKIQLNTQTNGYDILTAGAGQRYAVGRGDIFSRTPVAGTSGTDAGDKPPPGEKPAPGIDPDEKNLERLLENVGLGGIFGEAWKYFQSLDESATMADIETWLIDQPAYQARFPAAAYLRDQGQAWSVGDLLEYEFDVKEIMRDMPAQFWDQPEDFANLIRNGWSVDEVGAAVTQAKTVASSTPPEVLAELSKFGVNPNDIAAFYLDPATGGDLMKQKETMTKAGIAFGGRAAGLDLTAGEATKLYQRGATAESAMSTFETLGSQAALFSETADEGDDLGRQTMLDVAGGGAEGVAAAGKIEKRKRSRQARFEGGGGAQGLGQGRSGLG